jgi:hypothetical protein
VKKMKIGIIGLGDIAKKPTYLFFRKKGTYYIPMSLRAALKVEVSIPLFTEFST